MRDTKEHTLTQNDEWAQQNATLLAQAEDERANGHLWNATLLEAQYHDSEAKRCELLASREARAR